MPSPSLEDVEYKLKVTQESLVFALQSGSMGTWDFCIESGSINCSQELLDIWNLTPEEFNNQRAILQDKVHPEDAKKMRAAIDEAIKTRSVYEFDYRILPSPGTFKWVHARGRCTFDPVSKEPRRFAGVVYDITEKKKKEEELIASAKIRDQFFQLASHELKTPLTCLNLQMKIMEWELKEQSDKNFSRDRLMAGLRKQQAHLNRIGLIVDNILDERKITAGRLLLQYEHFDLCEMVSQVLEDFELKAQTNGAAITFEKDYPVYGMWDRFRLEQVLQNLLSNAVRYGNQKPIVVEVTKSSDHALLTVRDHGFGIKLEDQERIFGCFERIVSQNQMGGLGLGLYISKNIVRDHSGEIHLKSQLGKGSEFTVRIPLNLNRVLI